MKVGKSILDDDEPAISDVDFLERPNEEQLRTPQSPDGTEVRTYYTRLLAVELRERVKEDHPGWDDREAREWLLKEMGYDPDGLGSRWAEMEAARVEPDGKRKGKTMPWHKIDKAMCLLEEYKGIPDLVVRDHNKIKKALAALRELGLETAVLEYGGWKFAATQPSINDILDRLFDG